MLGEYISKNRIDPLLFSHTHLGRSFARGMAKTIMMLHGNHSHEMPTGTRRPYCGSICQAEE